MLIVFTKFPVKVEFNEKYSSHLKEAVTKHQVEGQAGFLEMKLLAPQHMPHVSEANNFTIETRWEDMKRLVDGSSRSGSLRNYRLS